MRIGNGYDVHKLVEGRRLVLGGTEIPFDKGLLGHSDADVLVHAIIDALIGAAGLGDIGLFFPDTSRKFKDIDSLILLERIGTVLAEEGYKIVNIDSVIVAQRPKLLPYIPEMRRRIAGALNIDAAAVNIKAKTEETLGFTGKELGMSAHAVVLID